MPNLVASCTSSRRSCDRAADEHLVVPGAVHVGGVEERDAELERAVDGRDRLVPVARAVALAHAHAAEALRGDGQTAEVCDSRDRHAFDSSHRAARRPVDDRSDGAVARAASRRPSMHRSPDQAVPAPAATGRDSGAPRSQRRRTPRPAGVSGQRRPRRAGVLVEQRQLHEPQRLESRRVASRACRTPPPASWHEHVAGLDEPLAPVAVLVPQRAVEHPADDFDAAVRVRVEAGAGLERCSSTPTSGPNADVVRVVVRAGGEAVPGRDAGLLGPVPLGGAADLDHGRSRARRGRRSRPAARPSARC